MDNRFDSPDDLTLATSRRLMQAALRMKRSVGLLLNQSGLTGAQFHTLVRIPEEGIPLTKLAVKAWADPGNASGVVDRLEREGLVERRPATHDRRVVQVHTTPAGRRRIEELWPEYVSCIQGLMAPLDEEQLARLGELLERIGTRDE